MKKTAIIISVFAISLAAGCKKEKDAEPCTCPSSAASGPDMYHFPLTVGSYWIYEGDNLDSSLNVTSATELDSVFISNDTTINGKQYFEKKVINLSGGTLIATACGFPSICRDSSGYMVNPSGSFIKHDDFTNILNVKTNSTPAYTIVSRMANKDSSVTVPAGTFNTINYLGKVTILESAYTGNRIKYNYDLMANNIGMVFQANSFYSSPNKIGMRLLRYHIAG